MLAAAGCPEMPMFNESCIVRHTDIRKPHEKPAAEKGCVPNAKKTALSGSTSGDTLPIVPLGPTLSRRWIRASVSTSAIKIRTE
jgi:hypothetical protein